MLYVGLAILLGTATMVVPLALLGPSDTLPDDRYIVTVPETAEPNNTERGQLNGTTLGGGNYTVQSSSPEATPEPAAPSEVSPQEPELTVKTAESPSDLSAIGLMTVPSFLVALGVFVYLRKRIS
jgi:hypothetical protein